MRLDLYWIPLGAGTPVVRASGKAFEAIGATLQRRPRRELFHAALVAATPDGPVTVEMAPTPDDDGRERRGVVAAGPVGMRWLGRSRVFRYEIRRWPGGDIPDLVYAVDSPVAVTDDPVVIGRALALLPFVPTPVWGRDELRLGEMWNSNSVASWMLTQAGVDVTALAPPLDGRAPGWSAGVAAADRWPCPPHVPAGVAPAVAGRP